MNYPVGNWGGFGNYSYPAGNWGGFGNYSYPAGGMMPVMFTNAGAFSGGCTGGQGNFGTTPGTNLFLLGTNAGGSCLGSSAQGSTEEQYQALHRKLDNIQRMMRGGGTSGGGLPNPSDATPRGSHSDGETAADPVAADLAARVQRWKSSSAATAGARGSAAPVASPRPTGGSGEHGLPTTGDAQADDLAARVRRWQDQGRKASAAERVEPAQVSRRGPGGRPADSSR
jgi:hypothetical protein